MAYCTLALVGFVIQRAVFGRLRVSEAQRVKDKFWNYVFYKFIFVFGVLNVQYMDEVLMWCGWFTLVGALLLLTQLSKDRFEYVSRTLFFFVSIWLFFVVLEHLFCLLFDCYTISWDSRVLCQISGKQGITR